MSGANPLETAAYTAGRDAARTIERAQVQAGARAEEARATTTELEREIEGLESGVQRPPPVPYTRAADARERRAGAPLWQLLDFRDDVTSDDRAGLEAALEAAGILDGWVTASGELLDPDTEDVLLAARMASAARPRLADALVPAIGDVAGVSEADVHARCSRAIGLGESDAPGLGERRRPLPQRRPARRLAQAGGGVRRPQRARGGPARTTRRAARPRRWRGAVRARRARAGDRRAHPPPRAAGARADGPTVRHGGPRGGRRARRGRGRTRLGRAAARPCPCPRAAGASTRAASRIRQRATRCTADAAAGSRPAVRTASELAAEVEAAARPPPRDRSPRCGRRSRRGVDRAEQVRTARARSDVCVSVGVREHAETAARINPTEAEHQLLGAAVERRDTCCKRRPGAAIAELERRLDEVAVAVAAAPTTPIAAVARHRGSARGGPARGRRGRGR